MSDKCPTHPDRPLVTEHTSGKKICLPCYFARMRKQRNERVTMTNEKHAAVNNARSKKAYHSRKAQS